MLFRSLHIRDASNDDIDYVVRRMRPEDRREVFGARFSEDVESVISEMIQARPFHAQLKAIARAVHPRPVALVGIHLVAPASAYANMIATPEWQLIVKDATRWIRNVLIPDCRESGLQRVELRALEAWLENRTWLERLGAHFECRVPGFGREPYVQYAWSNEGTEHVHFQPA